MWNKKQIINHLFVFMIWVNTVFDIFFFRFFLFLFSCRFINVLYIQITESIFQYNLAMTLGSFIELFNINIVALVLLL